MANEDKKGAADQTDPNQSGEKSVGDAAQRTEAEKKREAARLAAERDEGRETPETRSAFVDRKPPPAANVVRVGCKLPHGIRLRLHEKSTGQDGAARFLPTGQEILLNGRNSSNIIGGYGITDVPKDLWDAWVEAHKNYPPLTSGAIFAEPTRARAIDRAEDQRTLKTGTEPLNPEKPGPGLARVPEKDQRAALAGMGD